MKQIARPERGMLIFPTESSLPDHTQGAADKEDVWFQFISAVPRV